MHLRNLDIVLFGCRLQGAIEVDQLLDALIEKRGQVAVYDIRNGKLMVNVKINCIKAAFLNIAEGSVGIVITVPSAGLNTNTVHNYLLAVHIFLHGSQ
jgi:hypothetical protein